MKKKNKISPKTRVSQKVKLQAKEKPSAPQGKKLLEFWGRECPHCKTMAPLIDKLKMNLGIKIEQLEVWHNEKNARLLAEYDRDLCGGVPFFFNEATGEWICGETTYERLKAWAQGEKKKT